MPSDPRGHPGARVSEACAVYGAAAIARWCADLLVGEVAYDDPESPSLIWLGGPHAAAELRKGRLVERGQDYWPRVWAARGLLYAWAPEAARAVEVALENGLSDPAWRVREMCAKVARLREIGQAADALNGLVSDEVPRVRAAALGALGAVGEAEHAAAARTALDDPEPSVRRAAETTLAELRLRLDREL